MARIYVTKPHEFSSVEDILLHVILFIMFHIAIYEMLILIIIIYINAET